MTPLAGSQSRESIRLSAMVAALVVILVLLAAPQYRWLGQLSEGERTQMREFLKTAAGRFCQDFNSEVSAVYDCFRPQAGAEGVFSTLKASAGYMRWASSTQFPHLIRDTWLIPEPDGPSAVIRRLVPSTQEFRPSACSPEIDRLRGNLERRYQQYQSISVNRGLERRTSALQSMNPVWDDPPALIVPLLEFPSGSDAGPNLPPLVQGFIVVILNMDEIRDEFLPTLATRHFIIQSGSTYQISVVRRKVPRTIIFRIGPQPALIQYENKGSPPGDADVTAGLFSIQFPGLPGAIAGAGVSIAGSRGEEPQGTDLAKGRGRLGFSPLGLVSGLFGEEPWELRIQHRAGSLGAAVSAARRRNLAVNLGIVVLLGVSVISMVVATQRANRLARQQIEFVAAVSHELRTPLAVINTAAQNLADGIVVRKEQTRQYGTHIGTESMRLENMVEKVLEFARGQSRAGALELAPLRIQDLVNNALSGVGQQVFEGGFVIEKEIHPDLPNLLADEPSLRRALQNLLDNAMKYSGTSCRILLAAQPRAGRKATEIEISVRDWGIGISHQELPRVFDPFFRGKDAVSNNINGTGLGLSLVRSIVSAHHGRMLIDSKPGEGSTFSMALPAASPDDIRAMVRNEAS